jgi:radical SAM protein with 4Fe4S-binding SPASM domain
MNGRWTDRFLSYDRLSINVSLNAASARTYRLLSGTDQFDRVIENIRRIKNLGVKEGKGSPEIVLSFVAIKENIVELPEFIRLAGALSIKRVVVQDLIILHEGLRKHSLTPYADFAKSIFLVALNLAKEKGILLIPFVPVYFLPTDSDAFVKDGKLERKNSAGFCQEPWTNLRISSEGEIKPCCFSDEIMGNLYDQKLAEIWNGKKYRYIRKYVNSQDLPEDCRKCPRKVGATL